MPVKALKIVIRQIPVQSTRQNVELMPEVKPIDDLHRDRCALDREPVGELVWVPIEEIAAHLITTVYKFLSIQQPNSKTLKAKRIHAWVRRVRKDPELRRVGGTNHSKDCV